jgi:nucleoside-diphosphate-sugar epimerase
MRVAVTGGSGFIGARDVPLVSIDLLPPGIPTHKSKWAQCDVLDASQLTRILCEFAPTHVLHMAARTDLRGQSLPDYAANVAGVQRVVEAIRLCKSVERVIFASSMLVCHLGYRPKNDTDFAPTRCMMK